MKRTGLLILSSILATSALAFNLPKQPTKTYDCTTCDKLAREPLQEKWNLPGQPINTKVSNLQRSYGYHEKISLKQLQSGYVINTKAPGAVVRIVPLNKGTSPSLLIKAPNKPFTSLKEASKQFSEDETFGDERLTPKHQHLLQIEPSLGAGDFIIKAEDKDYETASEYFVTVFDKFATSYMEVSTTDLHYQYGDTLNASIKLRDDLEDCSVKDVEAHLIGPAGQDIPLEVKKVGIKRFEAFGKLTSELNDKGENWYVDVSVNVEVGSYKLKRTGHAAFSYTVPSASLISVKKISSKPLTFVAAVEVATASRYALQSILYRKNGKGEVTPLETTQRAQWLEPGKQLIQFTFDNSNQFAEDTLYLGYFRLTDYGQMSCVYQFTQPLKLTQLVE